eukprot:5669280-Pyramimonas_sp.AAC.1
MDGWTAAEIELLKLMYPDITRELPDSWVETSSVCVAQQGRISNSCRGKAFAWRVAGIPRGEDGIRPI